MVDHRSETAQQAVVAVGGGRGIVVRDRHSRAIITAAHCLPELPPAFPMPNLDEITYRELLGPLGGDLSVSAECLFVDPVGDIAVLTSPDTQECYEEAGQYDDLTENHSKCVPVGPAPESKSQGWLLSLDNTLLPCKIEKVFHTISVSEVEGEIVGGMSGSPILDQAGRAVGLVSTNRDCNPCLAEMLPAWLLRRFGL